MKSVKIRNTVLGEGLPKICVPLVAENEEELTQALEKLEGHPFDLVEWRIDFYTGIETEESRSIALEKIRTALGEKPLLVTFRTGNEGGNRSVTDEEYAAICKNFIRETAVDLIDVEAFREEAIVKDLIQTAHENGKLVVGSNHDFQKTPAKDDITGRLTHMQELGMDITKIAVMPQCEEDVLELLSATVKMKNELADRPFVTMSMGKTGVISRAAGTLSGSAITFGSVGKTSAPGQIPSEVLSVILNALG